MRVIYFNSNDILPHLVLAIMVCTVANNPKIVALTPEQFELGIKLEGIFMPHVRRQRDKLYKISEGIPLPARFVHYTAADAALKIIEKKRIWMRNTTCMSDYREVQHGFSILNKFFLDKAKQKLFDDALEPCASGAAQEAIGLFNQWWQNIQFNTFVTSISEHDDREDGNGRLSMWRAFGGNAARVAIVFKIPWQSNAGNALNLMFSPVAYFIESEVEQLLFEVIENIKKECEFLRSVNRPVIVGTFFMMLVAGVTCLKHEGFREEREWRGIYSPTRNPSPLMESSTEVLTGVPQVVHKVPLDVGVAPELADLDLARIFDRLIIGPSQFAPAIYEAFVVALKKIGVADAENRVVASNIPIRT